MKVVALPRDGNPYQELLYRPMRDLGAQVVYAGELTPSRTLNQLLLPFELAWRRCRGFRVLHIHWLFNFRFPGSSRSRAVSRFSRTWLSIVLNTSRLCGYRVVWTAHNVLPHLPIFDDDAAARRTLVRRCALVIAHGQNGIDGLAGLGATPSRSIVIPPGSYDLPAFATLPAPPAGRRTFLYFGQILAYKGVDDLLIAALEVDADFGVVIAGVCRDPRLRVRLEEHAAALGSRARLLMRFIQENEVAPLFAEAHAVVLPFRSITTSSSVLLAMASGRPVVVPQLSAFDEIPDDALIRYLPGTQGLAACLKSLTTAPAEELRDVGQRGRIFSVANGWDDVAQRTLNALRSA